MSLLIKGIDMPKNGEITIAFASDENGKNTLSLILYNKSGNVIEHKGVVEIPTPHGRLIDADRLIAVLKSTTAISQSDYDLFNHIVGLIEHQPTVIETEE